MDIQGLLIACLDIAKTISLIIVVVLLIASVVFYFVFFKLENCYSYVIKEFSDGNAKYVMFRSSHAKLYGIKVPHALIMGNDDKIRHWQPLDWTDSPTLSEWLHDRGYIKIGDE